MNAAKPGPKPKRGAKQDQALTSAERKLAKKPNPKKSMGSKIRDILRGNA